MHTAHTHQYDDDDDDDDRLDIKAMNVFLYI